MESPPDDDTGVPKQVDDRPKERKPDKPIGRRDVIIAAISATVAWPLGKFFDLGADQITKILNKANVYDDEIMSRISEIDAQHRYLGDLFDFYGTTVHVKPGGDHWNYERTHPDNFFAATQYASALKKNGIDVSHDKGNANRDYVGSIILFGDPVSNALAAKLLQYDPAPGQPEVNPRQFVHKEGIFEFPFSLVICKEKLDDLGVTKQVSSERINTSITNPQNALRPFVPGIDGNNYTSDFLLVTVLPNILDRRSYDSGKKIVIFSGTHGPGTRAAALLMQDSHFLTSIYDQVKELTSWQSVIKCGNLTRWSGVPEDRQEPRSLVGDPVCLPVEINYQKIHEHFDSLSGSGPIGEIPI